METLDLDNVKYIKRWQEKYNFIGKLDVEACEGLVKAISKRAEKKGKKRKDGLVQAKLWLIEAFGKEKMKKKRECGGESRRVDDRSDVCYNCGKVRRYARDCRAPTLSGRRRRSGAQAGKEGKRSHCMTNFGSRSCTK